VRHLLSRIAGPGSSLLLAVCLCGICLAQPPSSAAYPIHPTGQFVSRYPEKESNFDIPPTLEELNRKSFYEFDPEQGVHLDGFTLFFVDDFGQLETGLNQYARLHGRDLNDGDYHLTLAMVDCPAITDLFVYVRYHQERWAPERIEPGSLFGKDGDRLWYERRDLPGVVTAGMTRIRPDRNGPIKFDEGVFAEFWFEERPADHKPHWLDNAPSGEHNRIDEYRAYEDPESGCVVLWWEEKNLGDLNNDGEVNIVDMIPVGRRYGYISTDAREDEWDWYPDGNHDGEVNYKDVWMMDQNYGNLLSGYRIYRRPADRPRSEEVLLPHRTYPIMPMSIHRPKQWDPIRRIEYRYKDDDIARTDRPQKWTYRIVAYNARDDREGEKSDVEFTISVDKHSIKIENSIRK
jgi:hypothetical protein